MSAGVLFALAAGLMWGLVFVASLLLSDYPAALLSVGRYVAFGLIALPLAWLDRARIRELARADWIEAGKLATIGNLLYYVLLAAAIQRAGGPLPTMIIGTLPVVIAITSNLRDARFVGLMLAIGLLASWLCTLCWNEASQRLPTALAGQVIVFETLAALACAFLLRGRWPAAVTLVGIALLVVGVMWALRVRPEPIALEPH